jgi:hypothetical protein
LLDEQTARAGAFDPIVLVAPVDARDLKVAIEDFGWREQGMPPQ